MNLVSYYKKICGAQTGDTKQFLWAGRYSLRPEFPPSAVVLKAHYTSADQQLSIPNRATNCSFTFEDIVSHSDLKHLFISEHTSLNWLWALSNGYAISVYFVLKERIVDPTNEQRARACAYSVCLCICLMIPWKTFKRFIPARYCCRDAPTSPHLLLTPNIWMSSAPHISIQPKPTANVNLQAPAQAFCGHKLTAVFTQDPPNIFFQVLSTCI